MRSLVSIAALSILVAACGAAPAAAPTASVAAATVAPTPTPIPEKVNIRFSFKANGQYAPFFLGVEKGFYRDEGLDVTLQEGTGGTQVVQTVAAGQDFMVTPGLDIVVTARAQGAPVKAVATIQGATPAGIAVLSNSGITAPEQLVGRKIMTSPGGTSNTLLAPYLRSVGVSPDKVTIVSVAGNAKIPGLLAKQADAVTVFGNDDFVAIQDADPGARFFAYGDKLQMYGVGLVVHEDTIKNKAATVKKLVRATIKAHLYTMDHAAEAVDAMFKALPDIAGTKESHVRRVQATLQFFKTTIDKNGCTGCMSDDVFKRMEDLLVEFGGLTKRAVNVSEYYTNDFLK
jgi:NitT/TauT family transport system substrate-binding protein